MITKASRVRLCRDVRYRIIDGEAVVVRQDEGEVVVLNPVGARVLDLVRELAEVAEILTGMMREYDSPPEALERDVLGFLQELRDTGVIDVVESAEPSDVA